MSTTDSQAKAKTTVDSKASVWKAKDEKKGGSRKTSPKPKGIVSKAQVMYSPKLNVVEDADAKTVLVKINARTQIRQIINYCLGKIRDSWKVTLNAFQMDLVKALTAAEVAKTRLPFLYQETSFIELEALPPKVKDGDKKEEAEVEKEEDPKTTKTRSGIKIVLSRVPFEVENHVGYQKPKPRTFMT